MKTIIYRKLRILVAILTTVLLFLTLISCFGNGKLEDDAVNVNKYEITFENLNETIYIRARSWGLAGNHQEIIVASSPITNRPGEYFLNKQFVFLDSTELYYKKQSPDVLLIYVDEAANIPQEFSARIKIEVHQFKTYAEIKDYADHYEDYGFTKVSVYPLS